MKKFIAGFLSAIVLTTAIYASSEIKAYLSNATKVQLNGKILELRDAKNQPIYPINYQGSTYLPVRAISQSLGLFVDYDEPTKTVILSKDKITKNDYFKANEVWKVDGGWELTVHSAEYVDYYNSFHKPDPKKIVLVRYSYKNLGTEGFSGEGLYFVPSQKVEAIGKKGIVADTYPLVIPYGKTSLHNDATMPTHIKVGKSLENAYSGISLSDEAESIRLNFEHIDAKGNTHSADFVVPIDKKK